MQPKRLGPAILVISAASIAFEIVLMRVFSLVQWHHFAYMIISLAMLGFGASGTFLALFRRWVTGREPVLLKMAAWLAAVLPLLCTLLALHIPFETFRLVSERVQFAYLLGLYVTLAAPFFAVSAVVALAFMANPRHVPVLYGYNMAGSGLGALLMPLLLNHFHPATLPMLLTVPLLAAAIALTVESGLRHTLSAAAVPVLAVVLVFAAQGTRLALPISEYKPLSYALQLPGAKVRAETHSPFAVVTAVESEMIRETPGQVATTYPWDEMGPFPRQIGLYYDAGSVSPIHQFTGDLDAFHFLDYVTSAAAYRLVQEPRAAVLGAGGGTNVLSALYHNAAHVTAVEVDPKVIELVNGELNEFSGHLYARPDTTAVVAEGRAWLRASPERFDLIHVPLFGAFTSASAGAFALNESYLYTVEAFELFLERLEPGGVLSLNCWTKTPARNAIKLFATAVEAARRAGIEHPGQHLVFIRSWNNATICVTRSPMTPDQVRAVREFAESRGFDLCHFPGIAESDANRFNLLEEPVYYRAAQALLSDDPDAFHRRYAFHVWPATDDCPYFFRFFRWRAWPRLMRTVGAGWVPFVEWGYIALVATVAQSVLAGVVLILLPLAVFARDKAARGVRALVVVNFGALGLAYMLIEIAFIQKYMLFLGYPVYAVGVVLTGFLAFSGLGSLVAGRLTAYASSRVLVAWGVLAICLVAVLSLVVTPVVFAGAAGWPDPAKIAISLVLLGPLAFAMGIPFPVGMKHIASGPFAALLPWAWGVNGCASVVGATAATLAAVHMGFLAVVFLGLASYLVAAAAFQAMARQQRSA